MRRALTLLLTVLLLATRPAAGAEEAEAALEALGSPAERVRQEGVRRLVSLLPGSRDAVIRALAEAAPGVKLHLVEVLARDGSAASVRALLGALRGADDLLASRIQRLLARDAAATRAVLQTWEAEPGLRQGTNGADDPRMEALAGLLRRAEAEGLFLSRRSRTGSTGSYRGQYAVLEPLREEAIALCVDILLDRAPALPGVVPVGKFSFVRETDVPWDIDEIQSMAAHAFGELARPDDYRALLPLTSLLKQLQRDLRVAVVELGGWPGEAAWQRRWTRFLRVLDRYTDLLIALHRVHPEKYRSLVEDLIEDLRWDYRMRSSALPSTLPVLLLRTGRYGEAVVAYEELLDGNGRDEAYSRALAHYNLACALSQWGLELEGGARRASYDRALGHLARAVEAGWTDVGWLDEDRDLDPIRDNPRFATLRARMVEAITPPEDD